MIVGGCEDATVENEDELLAAVFVLSTRRIRQSFPTFISSGDDRTSQSE